MKTHENKEGSRERRVLAAMITDDIVLSRISAKWDGEPLLGKVSNIVGGMCVAYHRKHGKAPGKAMAVLLQSWEDRHPRDKEMARMLGKFLSELSQEYSSSREVNSNLLVNLAAEHLDYVKLSRAADSIKGWLDNGRRDKAWEAVSGLSRTEMRVDGGVDPILDGAALTWLNPKLLAEPLFPIKGAAGRFFAHHLARDCLVSFLAPEKGYKSYLLQELCVQAVMSRRRVAMFQVGDMSEDQIGRRILSRICRHPCISPTGKWPCVIDVPVSITPVPKGTAPGKDYPKVEYERREFRASLNPERAERLRKKFMMEEVRSKQSLFRLKAYSNDSINVEGIRSVLESWAQEDFHVDVCCIDYADILAAPAGFFREQRDAINATWKQLRKLSQDLHCLLLVATQANAESYGKRSLGMRDFSNDKRKRAHVTCEIGINATEEERKRRLLRLNMVVVREGEIRAERQLWAAHCLSLANPLAVTCF